MASLSTMYHLTYYTSEIKISVSEITLLSKIKFYLGSKGWSCSNLSSNSSQIDVLNLIWIKLGSHLFDSWLNFSSKCKTSGTVYQPKNVNINTRNFEITSSYLRVRVVDEGKETFNVPLPQSCTQTRPLAMNVEYRRPISS